MSTLNNELGDFHQNSHNFLEGQRKVSGIENLPLTFRLPPAYLAAHLAAYLAFTGSPISRLFFSRMIVLSATKSLPVLGLPTGFYQNIHKYYREAKVVAYLATKNVS